VRQERATAFRVASRWKAILGILGTRIGAFYKRLGFFYLTFGAGFLCGCAFTGFLCGLGKFG
jgi:hypothetical protein